MQGMAQEHQHGRGLLTNGEASLTLQFSGGTPPTVPIWKLWHKEESHLQNVDTEHRLPAPPHFPSPQFGSQMSFTATGISCPHQSRVLRKPTL